MYDAADSARRHDTDGAKKLNLRSYHGIPDV